jgi:hypothetical protein
VDAAEAAGQFQRGKRRLIAAKKKTEVLGKAAAPSRWRSLPAPALIS